MTIILVSEQKEAEKEEKLEALNNLLNIFANTKKINRLENDRG